MPSLITGVIGGIQAASAAHNAAAAQEKGYQQAAGTVNQAVSNANPLYSTAASGVTSAAATAGAGVEGAAGAAQTGINTAAADANGVLNPYIQNGQSASDRLNNLTTAGFNFNPSDLANTPGYQFALTQGLRGVNASGAATGGLDSGANIKAAAGYAQGLASTTYQQQYQDALNSYQANVNSLLPGAQMGLTASGQAGANLMNAAQYSGNTGLAGAEYAGNTGIAGAEYAGSMDAQQAQNLINAGVYTGNTQIGTGNAIAQGDIGAANQWNSMLGSIGTAGNQLLTAGFGGFGGGSPGTFSMGNLATGLSNMYGGGGMTGGFGHLYNAGGWTGGGGYPGAVNTSGWTFGGMSPYGYGAPAPGAPLNYTPVPNASGPTLYGPRG